MTEIPPEAINSAFRNKSYKPKTEEQENQEPQSNGNGNRNDSGKGVVLDKDGKPCRLCTSAASWKNLVKHAKENPPTPTFTPETESSTDTFTRVATSPTPPPEPIAVPTDTTSRSASAGATTSMSTTEPECPPDVEALGRSTWTLLHSLTSTYPARASREQQSEMRGFLGLLSRLYPCWVCADDFRAWMNEPSGRNQPRLATRGEFGNWMCEAHNEVNRKLGKKEFDCRFWEERWRSGWRDGRCD